MNNSTSIKEVIAESIVEASAQNKKAQKNKRAQQKTELFKPGKVEIFGRQHIGLKAIHHLLHVIFRLPYLGHIIQTVYKAFKQAWEKIWPKKRKLS